MVKILTVWYRYYEIYWLVPTTWMRYTLSLAFANKGAPMPKYSQLKHVALHRRVGTPVLFTLFYSLNSSYHRIHDRTSFSEADSQLLDCHWTQK